MWKTWDTYVGKKRQTYVKVLKASLPLLPDVSDTGCGCIARSFQISPWNIIKLKYNIGLAKKFIRAFHVSLLTNSKQTSWPTQYKELSLLKRKMIESFHFYADFHAWSIEKTQKWVQEKPFPMYISRLLH